MRHNVDYIFQMQENLPQPQHRNCLWNSVYVFSRSQRQKERVESCRLRKRLHMINDRASVLS